MANVDTILDALADAVEGITPGVLPNVLFARWRGPGLLGAPGLKPAPRHRQFQFQLGDAGIPRTMSGASDASTWFRAELRLVVCYDPKLPRTFDTNGIGFALEVTDDHDKLWAALVLGNPVSSSTYRMKRLVPLSPWATSPRPEVRVYRFDFEWTR